MSTEIYMMQLFDIIIDLQRDIITQQIALFFLLGCQSPTALEFTPLQMQYSPHPLYLCL